MGYYVHIHVAFSCDEEDLLRAIAANHLACPEAVTDPPECRLFLQHLAGGKGVSMGPKGALCTWGCVGNYTSGTDFAEHLADFWPDLFAKGVICDFERIVIFWENEQSESPSAIQISYEDGRCVSKTFEELPFSWGQM